MTAEAYLIDTEQGGPHQLELTAIVEFRPPLNPASIRRKGLYVDDSPATQVIEKQVVVLPIRFARIVHERGGNSLFATDENGKQVFREVVVYQKKPSSTREFLRRLGYELKASDQELVSSFTYGDAAKKNLFIGIGIGTAMGVVLTSALKRSP